MGTISLVIPQIGQPDTTEDVKLQNDLTAIQTVINGNLDTSNVAANIARLQRVLLTTSGSAVNGQLVEFAGTGPATITLPTPATSAMVGIFAGGVISGASPVTVTASSGLIFDNSSGTGAASKTMGSSNSCVVVVGNGSNWLTVSGQWDTGWTALSLTNATVTGAPWYSPQVRVIGDRAFLRGAASQTGAGTVTLTLPAVAFPASQANVVAMDFTANAAEALLIHTAGTMTVLATAGHTITLDGLSYSIV